MEKCLKCKVEGCKNYANAYNDHSFSKSRIYPQLSVI